MSHDPTDPEKPPVPGKRGWEARTRAQQQRRAREHEGPMPDLFQAPRYPDKPNGPGGTYLPTNYALTSGRRRQTTRSGYCLARSDGLESTARFTSAF